MEEGPTSTKVCFYVLLEYKTCTSLCSGVREVSESNEPVVDVDGSYMYRKKQQLSSAGFTVATLPAPTPPLSGWEPVTLENSASMSKNIPFVTPGLFEGIIIPVNVTKISLQGYSIHIWQPDVVVKRLREPSVPCKEGIFTGPRDDWIASKSTIKHPHFCHVHCNMTPSMKAGVYHVYLLLGKQDQLATIDKATCECAAG